MSTCLRRRKLIHDKTSLSVAEQPCLSQSELACCKVGLSTAKQSYPWQINLISDQQKVIRAEVSLSAVNPRYPREIKVICRKLTLFAAS
jgi:hypothetical protein